MFPEESTAPNSQPWISNPESGSTATARRQIIRILIADDNQAFLDAARAEFSLHPDYEVVACVRTGKGALAMSQELTPHVVFLDLFAVLLDLFVPGQNAMETVVRLKALPRAPKVVILSHRDSDDYRPAAFAAGADEFLTKPHFKLLARSMVRKLTQSI